MHETRSVQLLYECRMIRALIYPDSLILDQSLESPLAIAIVVFLILSALERET